MIKRHLKTLIITSIVILLPMAFGLCAWNHLPERIATHWGVDGNPDGWSGRGFAVFGLPLFMLAMQWLCTVFTSFDPKNNKGQNAKPMTMVLWLIPAISVVVNAIVYAIAFGLQWRVEMIMPLFMGVLFMVIGNYMPKCRQNHTLGIRLPWTLDDEGNWNATHRFAGRVWVIGGVLVAVCALIPLAAMVWVMLALIFALVILPCVYSYRYYQRHRES